MLLIDHLARAVNNSHSKWKYPSKEDIQLIDLDQIVECNIDGECDMPADLRKRFFNFSNVKTILCAYKKNIS